MTRRSTSRRGGHPDDALRRLARSGRPTLGQTVDPGRTSKPPSATRQFNTAAIVVLALATAGALVPFAVPQNQLAMNGIKSGSILRASGVKRLQVKFVVGPTTALAGLDVRLDGQVVPIVRKAEFALWTPPPTLSEGPHRLSVRSGSSVLWRGPARRELRFVVDRVRPELSVRARRNVAGSALVIEGSTEVGVELRVNGVVVPVVKDGPSKGTFRADFRRAPIGTVEIVASDPAGNRQRRLVRTRLQKQKIRAVHVTPRGWLIRSVRDPTFRMAANGQINAVMLTLKDEEGYLAYKSSVAKALNLGASSGVLDLRRTVDELHTKGLRVVGRVVAFRDPLYVADAVKSGQLDRVARTVAGDPFVGSDGVFANPVNPDAQQYVLDIVAEVANSGIDDLILDDVRRPGGDRSSMQLTGLPPGLAGLDESLAAFTRRAGAQLRGLDVGFGITVLGASIEDPTAYGQNLARLAPIVDYIAPKLFPSRFPPGTFAVANPAASPHDIVAAAIKAVFRKISSTDAAILPFLQDFSEGRPNGPADVRAQIDAVDELGVARWVLVDPKMSYNTGGIPKTAKTILKIAK